ncbi:MAG: hypothetical protein V1779_13630, partial [bacterium]
MKKVVNLWVSGMFNHMKQYSGIKYFVFFLILTANINNCISNDILWERLPSGNNEGISYYENPDCVVSSDNQFIITINSNTGNNNWISVYDKNNCNLVNKILFQSYKPFKQKNIIELFARKDSNIICCIYLNCGIDTNFFNARFYEIPSLKLIDTIGRYGLPEDLSSDFHYQVSCPLTNRKKFYYIDNYSQKIIFTDSITDDSGLALNINTIKFSPDNNFLIIQTYFQSNVYIYDVNKHTVIWNDDIDDDDNSHTITICDISLDMNYMVFCSSMDIYIYNFQIKDIIDVINLENFTLFSPANISISNNNQYLLLSNHTQFAVFDILNNSVIVNSFLSDYIKTIPGSNNYTYDYFYKQFFTPDNKNILLSSYYGQYYFNFVSKKLEELFSTHIGSSLDGYPGILKFANNDQYLITIGTDKTIIWDAQTGKFIKALDFSRKSEDNNTIAIYPDTENLIYSSDSKIYFYNFVDDVLADEIEVRNNVLQLAVSGNGKYLGYTMSDSSFAIYDLEEGSVIYSNKIKLDTLGRVFGIFLSEDHLVCITTIEKEIYNIDDIEAVAYDFLSGQQIDFFF